MFTLNIKCSLLFQIKAWLWLIDYSKTMLLLKKYFIDYSIFMLNDKGMLEWYYQIDMILSNEY
jgi:hypothetical protein